MPNRADYRGALQTSPLASAIVAPPPPPPSSFPQQVGILGRGGPPTPPAGEQNVLMRLLNALTNRSEDPREAKISAIARRTGEDPAALLGLSEAQLDRVYRAVMSQPPVGEPPPAIPRASDIGG
jgi:hypothetical protein